MTALTRRLHRGATLVESMVALMVIAISAAGFMVSLTASAKYDQLNDARTKAQEIANELAASISNWPFSDARLTLDYNYADTRFSAPRVQSFTLTPANTGTSTPASVVETFDYPPDHDEAELAATDYIGRAIAETNLTGPGRYLIFRRYWNVVDDPNNRYLRIVAVHVTYQRGSSERGVASAFTAVHDSTALSVGLVQ